MKLRKLVIILIIFRFAIFTVNIKGQTAFKIFNSDHNTVRLNTTFSQLKNTSNIFSLYSPKTIGMSLAYHYIFSLKNFYGIGIGSELGYINYRIQPSDISLSLYSVDNKLISIRIPFFINKYYPFNNKFAINVKVGGTINTLISSLSNFGNLTINNNTLFETFAKVNASPEIGGLFEIGGSYSFKNQNFLTFCLIINNVFFHNVEVNYEYYPLDNPEIQPGEFEASGSFIGISLSYNFKRLKND